MFTIIFPQVAVGQKRWSIQLPYGGFEIHKDPLPVIFNIPPTWRKKALFGFFEEKLLLGKKREWYKMSTSPRITQKPN
jgi:hypothetical protein